MSKNETETRAGGAERGAVGLLFDVTRCVGCSACVVACNREHGFPLPREGAAPSSPTFTSVHRIGDRNVRKLCWHCEVPTCVSVCPVKAIEKDPAGPVVYHEDRCMGCRYCMQACPFGVPRYEWESRAPRIRKCSLCVDRVREGRPTACSEACPTRATIFGERDALLREAEERIRANPDRYHPRVYGSEELGGSSVLMISDVPLETLGLYPAGAGAEPLPELTASVLRKIPAAVAVGGVLLGGIWWITRRRMRIEDERLGDHDNDGSRRPGVTRA